MKLQQDANVLVGEAHAASFTLKDEFVDTDWLFLLGVKASKDVSEFLFQIPLLT